MAEAGRSKRMRKLPWTGAHSDEEARATLQARLVVFSKMMFWSFVVLLAFLAAMYRAYPQIQPRNNTEIFMGAAVGLAVMAVIWRVVLVRRPDLSMAALERIDVIYATTIGAAFGASAYLAWDLRPAGYTSLVYASFFVFTRAIIVPSSGTRTAVLATLAMLPMTLASVGLTQRIPQELPAPAFVVGATLLAGVAVLLSTIGSDVIYGLRRQVSEAMQLGVYTTVSRLGHGGMGVVYVARHHLLRRRTAVKVLSPDRFTPEDLERFEREVHAMSLLTHPNTVAVYDYGRSDGRLYYAMELLDGMDLRNLVGRHGPMASSSRVAQILAQVCGALQEAHERGLVHRDITPANIMLCERGGIADFAKVLDFGLVKEITPADASVSQQVVVGTPDYMSPEALTEANVTPSRDLYALGAVGYFLLTGRRVFEGKTVPDTIVQHATRPPTPPSAWTAAPVDPGLETIVLRCLAKQPAARFASAAALAEALEALPCFHAWTRADAKAWWRDHRTLLAMTPTSDAVTLTIDLAPRGE